MDANGAADPDRTSNGAEPRLSDADQVRLDTAQSAADADQMAADRDQAAADSDQKAADADQTAAATDQTSADRDQRSSDRDQATADRDHAAHGGTDMGDRAYEESRDQRAAGSFDRLANRLKRTTAANDRDVTAERRDRAANARDDAGRARDVRAASVARAATEAEASLIRQLDELATRAATDRARAAADRERAAADRADAARERDRLEAELRSAHLDDLTGAYRREMGRLALSNEIDRARRSDGRFVLAFVDVDGLKIVNDRDGHAAGDEVLQIVVRTIRTNLRSFDPIIRYGGDEFVCGLGGTDIAEAERRFETIGAAIEADARVAISVGLATLATDDTADRLTERADAAMLEVKALHHSRA